MNIRGKSVGESIDLLVTCGDDGKTEVSVNVPINDIQVITSEEHTTDIEIGDGWTVKMKYPSLTQFIENNFTDDKDAVEKSFELYLYVLTWYIMMKICLSASECTKKELKEWVESLTSQQFAKIENSSKLCPNYNIL